MLRFRVKMRQSAAYPFAPMNILQYGWNQQQDAKAAELNNSFAVADTTAAREAGDYQEEANRMQAEQTNSLAQRLATARRTPGGGIRTAIRRKGFNASLAGTGLNAVNAKNRLARRQSELRAKATADHAQKYQGTETPTFSLGEPITLW